MPLKIIRGEQVWSCRGMGHEQQGAMGRMESAHVLMDFCIGIVRIVLPGSLFRELPQEVAFK